MRYPDFLPENGTIGFVAPSFGCATEPYKTSFKHALEHFQRLGYHLRLGANCYAEQGIGISNEPRLCGGELNDMYSRGEVGAIISCGGGELMCEVVPYIDFERIAKEPPKWYMGYSDNTNFTFLSTTLCDTAAVYGPCAPAFGMEPWHPSLEHALELLAGRRDFADSYDLWEKEGLRDEEHPLEPYHVTEPVEIRIFEGDPAGGKERVRSVGQAQIEGRLLGGCLDCLVTLLGTRFDRVRAFTQKYADDGIIWFLESCDLNLMGIRRALWQMKEAGWFEHVKGFVIGRPYCFGAQEFGIDHYRAVTDLLGEYKVPVIMDADIGHLPPMMPMVCGALAQITAGNGRLHIQYMIPGAKV